MYLCVYRLLNKHLGLPHPKLFLGCLGLEYYNTYDRFRMQPVDKSNSGRLRLTAFKVDYFGEFSARQCIQKVNGGIVIVYLPTAAESEK